MGRKYGLGKYGDGTYDLDHEIMFSASLTFDINIAGFFHKSSLLSGSLGFVINFESTEYLGPPWAPINELPDIWVPVLEPTDPWSPIAADSTETWTPVTMSSSEMWNPATADSSEIWVPIVHPTIPSRV